MDGSKIDPSFYPAVFGIEEGDDWEDEAVWRRVNPSIGVTIPFETVKAAYEQAKQNPAEEMHFRQFRLNEWCNADIRWMPMDKWDALGEDIDWEEFEGRDCYCGLDLSSTGDLTALVLVFPPAGGDTKYTVLPFFWLPGMSSTCALGATTSPTPYGKRRACSTPPKETWWTTTTSWRSS
jgi:phage terminase large subunit-like protein